MDCDKGDQLDALMKRRQQLTLLADRKRKMLRSTENIEKHHTRSVSRDSSDRSVIENSDADRSTENIAKHHTRSISRNSSDRSVIENNDADTEASYLKNNLVQTSTISIPPTRTSFLYPETQKANPNRCSNKVNVISDILIKPADSENPKVTSLLDADAGPTTAALFHSHPSHSEMSARLPNVALQDKSQLTITNDDINTSAAFTIISNAELTDTKQPPSVCVKITSSAPAAVDKPENSTNNNFQDIAKQHCSHQDNSEAATLTLLDHDVPPSSSNVYENNDDINDNITNRRKKRKIAVPKKQYIDFLSDDEKDFSAGSSELWSYGESDYSSEDNSKIKKNKNKVLKKVKQGVNNVEIENLVQKKEKLPNKKKMRKKLKDEGKSYETRKGEIIPEKKMKENPCIEGKCIRKCYEITEERRTSLFGHFYSMDIQRRRDWLLRCSRHIPVKRKRTSNPESRRNSTNEYYINDGEDHRPVCQKFLLHTLDITQRFLVYTIQSANEDMAKKDQRKPNCPPKYTEETKNYVRTFIEKLPKMPLHYSRKRSQKMYIPQEFKNLSHLYRIYLQDCKTNGKDIVSEVIFRQIFKEYNIGIHVPKKDKCALCTMQENNKDDIGTIDATEFQNHLDEKAATYKGLKLINSLSL